MPAPSAPATRRAPIAEFMVLRRLDRAAAIAAATREGIATYEGGRWYVELPASPPASSPASSTSRRSA